MTETTYSKIVFNVIFKKPKSHFKNYTATEKLYNKRV